MVFPYLIERKNYEKLTQDLLSQSSWKNYEGEGSVKAIFIEEPVRTVESDCNDFIEEIKHRDAEGGC